VSTAALMHNRIDDSLPSDAEPLCEEGYFCVVSTHSTSWSSELYFNVVKGERPYHHIFTARVRMPDVDWRGRLSKTEIYLGQSGASWMDTSLARVASETIFLAAEFGRVLDALELENNAEKIARMEAQRAAAEAEREARRAEINRERNERLAAEKAIKDAQQALTKERKELLQWHVGDKFRLKRNHHKTGRPMAAVVFGEIVDFIDMPDGSVVMTTVSEKGKPMRIYLHCITKMDIKEHEADKKYSRKIIGEGIK
jgi:hypothetical protein